MINKPFTIQTIFCQIANKYFSSQGVSVFYTTPQKTPEPYIKVSQISVLKQEHANPDLIAVQLGLTVYTSGVCNSQILNIIQCLNTDISILLNGAQDIAKTIFIQNAYINDWKINEIIDRRCWNGTCDMIIIGGLL